MLWPNGVSEGVFERRHKRFFADFTLADNDELQVAHVANTGSLKSVLLPPQPCLVSKATNPERKLQWTLEALGAADGSWVGVNTAWPNALAAEAHAQKWVLHWREFDVCEREYAISKATRLDLRLVQTATGKQHFVEVKSVTLKVGEQAQFPDAKTERGQKHLVELMKLQEQGHTAEILFVVQRSDVQELAPAVTIDPVYAELLEKAHHLGVRVSARIVEIGRQGLQWRAAPLPVRIGGGQVIE